MHLDNTIMKKLDYLYDEVSLGITEKERDNDIDSKDLDNTNNTLLNEELIYQKIEKAIKRIFVMKFEIDEPEEIIKKENAKNLFFGIYIKKKRKDTKDYR